MLDRADDVVHGFLGQQVPQATGSLDHVFEHLGVTGLTKELMRYGKSAKGGFQLGVSGKHDANRLRALFLNVLQQRRSVDAGHAHIADHDIKRPAADFGQGDLSTRSELPFPNDAAAS